MAKSERFEFSDVGPDQLFSACVRAAAELGFTTQHADRAIGQLTVNTGRSMSSFAGQNLTITVVGNEGGGAALIVGGSLAKGGGPFGNTQAVAWGEKGRKVQALATKVRELVRER